MKSSVFITSTGCLVRTHKAASYEEIIKYRKKHCPKCVNLLTDKPPLCKLNQSMPCDVAIATGMCRYTTPKYAFNWDFGKNDAVILFVANCQACGHQISYPITDTSHTTLKEPCPVCGATDWKLRTWEPEAEP